MSKPSVVNTWQSIALAVAGLCVVLAIAHIQPALAMDPPAPAHHQAASKTSDQPMTKRQLIAAILQEMGIAKRYDLYLGNAIDLAVFPNQSIQFIDWLNSVLVERAGWKTVALTYTRRLDDQFSEAELAELLTLAKNPTLQKLFQAELNNYKTTGRDRRQFLSRVWEDYNNGNIPLPDGLNTLPR